MFFLDKIIGEKWAHDVKKKAQSKKGLTSTKIAYECKKESPTLNC
jgi:hypothetical protein